MKPRTEDRRTFLRYAATLGGVTAVSALAGCLDGGPAPDVDTDAGTGPTADELDLASGVEIGMSFTALGGQVSRPEVDPDEPGGGRLITIETAEPGERVTLGWRQTIERVIPQTATADVGVGEDTPTPKVEIVEESGEVTATGLAAAHEPFLPMYWDPGEKKTETSAMWLSREAFQELRDTRETAWSGDVLTRISWVGAEAIDRIHDGVAQVDEVVLEAEPDFVDFELTVDGQRTTVRAIKAYDSFGNEYIIVANAANPLVVKFTYNAISVGLTGFDTGLWTLIKAVFSGYQVVEFDRP